jgi:hypothetical protein
MNEAEDRLAAELEETRDEKGEWGDESVEVDVRPSRMQVVSFRMPLEELETVVAAAKAAGESLSEFVRTSIALRLSPRAYGGPFVTIGSGVANGIGMVQIGKAPAEAGWNVADDVEPIELVAQGIPSAS